jgi:hypothetical protein
MFLIFFCTVDFVQHLSLLPVRKRVDIPKYLYMTARKGDSALARARAIEREREYKMLQLGPKANANRKGT